MKHKKKEIKGYTISKKPLSEEDEIWKSIRNFQIIQVVQPSTKYPEYNWIFGVKIHPCHRNDPDMIPIVKWLRRFSKVDVSSFCYLLQRKGTWLEDHVLMDWILEHDGKLWYRHVLWSYYTWESNLENNDYTILL